MSVSCLCLQLLVIFVEMRAINGILLAVKFNSFVGFCTVLCVFVQFYEFVKLILFN